VFHFAPSGGAGDRFGLPVTNPTLIASVKSAVSQNSRSLSYLPRFRFM